MSMNEFERHMPEAEDDPPLALQASQARSLPNDFTAEDMAFAQELDTLFDPVQEELPPYFVQTLLESDEPRFQVVETQFEKKTCARVFRRLNLRRRLFRSSTSVARTMISLLPARRSLVTVVAAVLLMMVLTMAYAAPSFAAGLNVLLAGPHSGVVQVHGYPRGLASSSRAHTHTPATPRTNQIDLLDAQRLLHFSMYWPQSNVMPKNYQLNNIYIYDRADQSWADGPLMELDYNNTYPGVTSQKNSRIAICEFKPMGQVLQVVQLGAAHQLEIDAQGHASAVYVDGQWTTIDQSSHVWAYSGRNELIYERDGIIFWLVGNQSEGVNGQTLLDIASSLQSYDAKSTLRLGRMLNNVTRASGQAPQFMDGDIFYLNNPDKHDGPTLKVVSADTTQPSDSLGMQRVQRLKSQPPSH